MDYFGLSVQGAILLLFRHGYEIESTLMTSADTLSSAAKALVVTRSAVEASLHSVLLVSTITQRRRLISFWVYYAYKLALMHFWTTFWLVYLEFGIAGKAFLGTALLWSVWHSAYQYLLREHDREPGADPPGDAVPEWAGQEAPNAPSWERDLESVFGWRRMSETNQVLADIFNSMAGVIAMIIICIRRLFGFDTD